MKQKPPINISLTKRDLDVLNILWESDDPKTAAQIVKAGPELTMNTVQAVLRKLLKNKLVEIAEIVYSGTVLTRSYKPIISQEDFLLHKMTSEYQSLRKKISKVSILSALLDTEEDTARIDQDLSDIEELVHNYKKTRH
ncbi:MAG: BlaI/MecI/CopY family transcriptional regulator [Lachnospiraceae bacterium]|jgi:Fe2+/Zn2+ uptake regulation proteins|nr:BlaI/MecI/CopY family transcriptional regulator [Lachnospiraceae bacterium]